MTQNGEDTVDKAAWDRKGPRRESVLRTVKDRCVRAAYGILKPMGVSNDLLWKLCGPRMRMCDWRRVCRGTRSPKILERHPDGPRIVMLPMIGGMFLTNFELPLALALQGRGANVELVYCDDLRPLCELTTIDELARKPKQAICDQCVINIERMLEPLGGLRVRYLREMISPEKNRELAKIATEVPFEKLAEFKMAGAAVGAAAYQTLCRHMRMGILTDTPELREKAVKLLHSALLTLEAARILAGEGPIHAAMMSHGIYASWAPALDYFKSKGIYTITYSRQARRDTWHFQVNAAAQRADIQKPFNQRWRDRPLTPAERQQALDYLKSRETFAQDPFVLTFGTRAGKAGIYRRLSLRDGIPVFTMFTNNMWDASAVGRDLVFGNVIEWVVKTIRFAGERPDRMQLVIKPHPAEKLRGTRQAVGDEVRKALPSLPDNVRLLEPDVDINSTSIMKATDVGLVHTSTVGMEMSIYGAPVVVTSWTHYRDLGFTFDPVDQADYFRMLEDPESLKARMTKERQELALKYFYVRFFRYCQEIPLLQQRDKWNLQGFNLSSLDGLLPGHFPNLDFVCKGILDRRTDFVRD